jgi:putative NIF3 family GTP cyclohydrolase 1 type 2
MKEAHFRGADVLVTGDVKYHDAREAEALGLAIIDAGHFATERLMVSGLAARIKQEFTRLGAKVAVIPFTEEQEPFSYL